VLNLPQSLAALDSYGIRFIAVSKELDTDASNPTSRLLLNVLCSVAEFEKELIKERTLSGIAAARAKGKTLGRPKRVFRRDEVVRLRDSGMRWRAVARTLGIPVMRWMRTGRRPIVRRLFPLESLSPTANPTLR
jgi:putative DNA-invertase from lambdoid prophage Rac